MILKINKEINDLLILQYVSSINYFVIFDHNMAL